MFYSTNAAAVFGLAPRPRLGLALSPAGRSPDQPRLVEIDAVTAQRYSFAAEPLQLRGAQRRAAVGPYDSMPRHVADAGEDPADRARGGGVDVGIGAHETGWDGSHPLGDARCTVTGFRTRRWHQR